MESIRRAAIQLVNDHVDLKLLLNEVNSVRATVSIDSMTGITLGITVIRELVSRAPMNNQSNSS